LTITITQLNKYIKSIIEKDVHLSDISVKGELSNFKQHSSGHCYMTLKDETSTIRAVMFKGSADKLRFMPENGMKVIVQGKISVYERDGQYQMYITYMMPDGIGDLHIAYEQLKEKLEKEGLFLENRKKSIPKFPKAVGVITSPTGAAVRDVVNVITRRYQLAEIIICPVLVQGDSAAPQIANAIEYMNNSNMCDVLIVGRGGGSIEELWAFNEEIVARAISNSAIPVISAVGHETDFTIADFVSDLRAPTPSAAAELAVPSTLELTAGINKNHGRMLFALKKNIEAKRAILSRFSVKNPINVIENNRIRIDNAVKHLTSAKTAVLESKSKKIAVLAARLNAMSPLGVLSRGYSVAQNEKGVVRSTKDVSIGANLSVKLTDGTLDCIVNSINKEK